MTRAIKWWKTISFWNKARMILGAIGIGGEITLFLVESFPKWKIVAAIATALIILITYFIKDENKNGLVDSFENKYKIK